MARHHVDAGQFVRAPDENGCAKGFISTMKEQLLWLERHDAAKDVRCALL